MLALEYLTQNSLTAYPFKTWKAIYSNNPNPIQDDWFYDILFVSITPEIRSVYISKIEKTGQGELNVWFNNFETGDVIFIPVNIAASELVDHRNNLAKSFAGVSTPFFSVKIVFGPGLVSKPPFTQTYIAGEAELASAAIVMSSPRIDHLIFQAYSPELSVIKDYSFPEVPSVKTNHNTDFYQTNTQAGILDVFPGIGAGLYDPCYKPGDKITDVYSVATVTPNTSGALFLKTSGCYALNTLTSNDATVYGSNITSGYLYKYRSFSTNRVDKPLFDVLTHQATDPTVPLLDAPVLVGNTLFIENFCSPKCPPESMNAFAHYLNRVTDGVKELSSIATRGVETRGRGEPDEQDPSVFNVLAFCEETHNQEKNPFIRCSDPAAAGYIVCGSTFTKYYHEGRTLKIYYDPLTIRSYTILEVFDDNRVRLDIPPTASEGTLWFKVEDTGVISNMNCAASGYNLDAAAYTQPYFKVKYTTSESYNSLGKYVTYLSVVIAIFNPSPQTVDIRALFSPTKLTHQGHYKIRKTSGITEVDSPLVHLGCREYAFIESVYYIGCGEKGGSVDISVLLVEGEVSTQIGDVFNLLNIDAAECPGTVIASGLIFRQTETLGAAFSQTVTLDSQITSTQLQGDIPSWLVFTPNYTAHDISFTASAFGVYPDTSKRYSMYVCSQGGTIPGAVAQLTLDYVAKPVITSPLGSKYTLGSPLQVVSNATYTQDNPILDVVATNMNSLSSDFPEDASSFTYSIEVAGGLPNGLHFDEKTGQLYGSLENFSAGQTLQLIFGATNPAGNATNPQTINLVVASEDAPEISFISPPEDNLFGVDNFTTFSEQYALYSLLTTNPPIRGYALTGTLPRGLTFSPATGQITGKITETADMLVSLGIRAINSYGESAVLNFTLNYTAYFAPAISYPTDGLELNINSSEASTLAEPSLTVVASQGYGDTDNYAPGLTDFSRNSYNAAGLPPGITLDLYSGKLYGGVLLPFGVNLRSYPVVITATNPAGSDSKAISLVAYRPGVPTINNINDSRVLYLVKDRVYTQDTPLFKVAALNSPADFNAEGLPDGLSITATGEIIGTVPAESLAKNYAVTLTAVNTVGVSSPVNCVVAVPVSILSPEINSTTSFLTTASSSLAIVVCDVEAGDTISFSATALPAGLSLVDNVLSGTGTTLGTYTVKIVATTLHHGYDTLTIIVQVLENVYSLAGQITDQATGFPTAGVTIDVNGSIYKTTTDDQGNFIFNGFGKGVYNLVAHKAGYSITPRFKAVVISNASVAAANFKTEGPLVLASGTIADTDNAPLADIVLTDGKGHTATTDIFGFYSIFVYQHSSVLLTPSSTRYAFTPQNIILTTDTANLTDVNFVGKYSSAPDSPKITSILPYSEKLTVAFTPPASDGGDTIVGYQYSVDGGTAWSETVTDYVDGIDITQSPADLSDLINGVTYKVRLRAVNGVGSGPQSSAVFATPASVPTAPTITSVDSAREKLIVRFIPPTNNGGSSITNYKYSINNGVYVYAGKIDTPIYVSTLADGVTPLASGVTYSIKLKAVNVNGESEPSASVSAAPAGTPSAPLRLTVTPTVSTLTLNFSPPENNNGSPVINYAFSLDDGATYVTLYPPTTTIPIVVSNLTYGTTYVVRVAAINALGRGQESAAVSVGYGSVPQEPTITSITPALSSVAVNFTPPDTEGINAVTNYAYSINDGASYTNVSPPSTASPIVISSGLTRGTAYPIRIRAINSKGAGLASSAVTGGLLAKPTAPTITSVEATPESVSINFTPPANSAAAAITAYKYIIYRFSAYTDTPPLSAEYVLVNSIASPIVVSNLSNGIKYAVKLKAVGAVSDGDESLVATATPVGAPAAPTINYVQGYAQPDGAGGNNYVADTGALDIFFAFLDGDGISSGETNISDVQYAVSIGDATPVYVSSGLHWSASGFPGWHISVTGLNGDTLYNVRLKAANSLHGFGLATAPYTCRTIRPPRDVVMPNLLSAESSLKAYFMLPPGGLALEAPTYYEWAYTTDGTAPTEFLRINSTASPLTLSGLTNGVTYSVVLRAVNPGGRSATSAQLTTKVIGAPTAPYITPTDLANWDWEDFIAPGVSIAPNGSRPMIQLHKPLNDGGGRLIDFEMLLTSTNPYNPPISDDWVSVRNDVVGITSVFEGESINYVNTFIGALLAGNPLMHFRIGTYLYALTIGEQYTIQLKAVNEYGFVSPASESLTFTAKELPGAPSLISILRGIKKVTISFNRDATSRSSPVTGYYYTRNGGDTYTRIISATAPVVLINLAEAVDYPIDIVAECAEGKGKPLALVVRAQDTLPTSLPSVTAEVTGAGTITVTVAPPASHPTGVGVTYKMSINGGAYVAQSTQRTFTVSGLPLGVILLKFRASTAAGDGPATPKAITVEMHAPPQPPVYRVCAEGDHNFDLCIAPNPTDSLIPVLNYYVEVDDWGPRPVKPSAIAANRIRVPDDLLHVDGLFDINYTSDPLWNNTINYSVNVYMTNKYGQSSVGPTLYATPKEPLPGAPTLLLTPLPGALQVDITYNSSDDSAIAFSFEDFNTGWLTEDNIFIEQGYVFLTSLQAGEYTAKHVSFKFPASGSLVAGKTYAIKARATNLSGSGPTATASAAAITANSKPVPPQLSAQTLPISVGSDGIRIPFEPGTIGTALSSGGSSVINYAVKLVNYSSQTFDEYVQTFPASSVIPPAAGGHDKYLDFTAALPPAGSNLQTYCRAENSLNGWGDWTYAFNLNDPKYSRPLPDHGLPLRKFKYVVNPPSTVPIIARCATPAGHGALCLTLSGPGSDGGAGNLAINYKVYRASYAPGTYSNSEYPFSYDGDAHGFGPSAVVADATYSGAPITTRAFIYSVNPAFPVYDNSTQLSESEDYVVTVQLATAGNPTAEYPFIDHTSGRSVISNAVRPYGNLATQFFDTTWWRGSVYQLDGWIDWQNNVWGFIGVVLRLVPPSSAGGNTPALHYYTINGGPPQSLANHASAVSIQTIAKPYGVYITPSDSAPNRFMIPSSYEGSPVTSLSCVIKDNNGEPFYSGNYDIQVFAENTTGSLSSGVKSIMLSVIPAQPTAPTLTYAPGNPGPVNVFDEWKWYGLPGSFVSILTVSWSKVRGATGYTINFPGFDVNITDPNQTVYVLPFDDAGSHGLYNNSKTAGVSIQAYNSVGKSAASPKSPLALRSLAIESYRIIPVAPGKLGVYAYSYKYFSYNEEAALITQISSRSYSIDNGPFLPLTQDSSITLVSNLPTVNKPASVGANPPGAELFKLVGVINLPTSDHTNHKIDLLASGGDFTHTPSFNNVRIPLPPSAPSLSFTNNPAFDSFTNSPAHISIIPGLDNGAKDTGWGVWKKGEVVGKTGYAIGEGEDYSHVIEGYVSLPGSKGALTIDAGCSIQINYITGGTGPSTYVPSLLNTDTYELRYSYTFVYSDYTFSIDTATKTDNSVSPPVTTTYLVRKYADRSDYDYLQPNRLEVDSTLGYAFPSIYKVYTTSSVGNSQAAYIKNPNAIPLCEATIVAVSAGVTSAGSPSFIYHPQGCKMTITVNLHITYYEDTAIWLAVNDPAGTKVKIVNAKAPAGSFTTVVATNLNNYVLPGVYESGEDITLYLFGEISTGVFTKAQLQPETVLSNRSYREVYAASYKAHRTPGILPSKEIRTMYGGQIYNGQITYVGRTITATSAIKLLAPPIPAPPFVRALGLGDDRASIKFQLSRLNMNFFKESPDWDSYNSKYYYRLHFWDKAGTHSVSAEADLSFVPWPAIENYRNEFRSPSSPEWDRNATDNAKKYVVTATAVDSYTIPIANADNYSSISIELRLALATATSYSVGYLSGPTTYGLLTYHSSIASGINLSSPYARYNVPLYTYKIGRYSYMQASRGNMMDPNYTMVLGGCDKYPLDPWCSWGPTKQSVPDHDDHVLSIHNVNSDINKVGIVQLLRRPTNIRCRNEYIWLWNDPASPEFIMVATCDEGPALTKRINIPGPDMSYDKYDYLYGASSLYKLDLPGDRPKFWTWDGAALNQYTPISFVDKTDTENFNDYYSVWGPNTSMTVYGVTASSSLQYYTDFYLSKGLVMGVQNLVGYFSV